MNRFINRIRTLRQARRGAGIADAGMTLLEIMIVLAIIGLIAGSVGVGVFNQFKKAQIKTAKTQVGEIAQAAERFMMNNNSACPNGIDDLVAQKELPKKPKDPWNKEFILKCPGQANTDGVDVISSGPDKQEGTADDVKYPEGAPAGTATP